MDPLGSTTALLGKGKQPLVCQIWTEIWTGKIDRKFHYCCPGQSLSLDWDLKFVELMWFIWAFKPYLWSQLGQSLQEENRQVMTRLWPTTLLSSVLPLPLYFLFHTWGTERGVVTAGALLGKGELASGMPPQTLGGLVPALLSWRKIRHSWWSDIFIFVSFIFSPPAVPYSKELESHPFKS